MKILHLSDTHGCHRGLTELPAADIVVHSGDFCMDGSEAEAIDFLNWFCDLPYAHKIFICGNHDDCLYGANIDGLDANVHYLCNSGVEIEGVKFYGVPMFMGDCITDRQSRNIAKIPTDTDVLITHTPPYGILDFEDNIHYGSVELLTKGTEINPQFHLFGHIHANNGILQIGNTTFVNSAILNSNYCDLQRSHLLDVKSDFL